MQDLFSPSHISWTNPQSVVDYTKQRVPPQMHTIGCTNVTTSSWGTQASNHRSGAVAKTTQICNVCKCSLELCMDLWLGYSLIHWKCHSVTLYRKLIFTFTYSCQCISKRVNIGISNYYCNIIKIHTTLLNYTLSLNASNICKKYYISLTYTMMCRQCSIKPEA